VLRDRDAYILFYAREDPGMAKRSIPTSPATKSFNGVEDQPLSSPGTKRQLDEDEPESPNKRTKVSDDNEPDDFGLKIQREPLKSVTNGNSQSHGPTIPKSYSKPLNGTYTKSATQLSQPIRRPYSPKSFPHPIEKRHSVPQVLRGAETGFMRSVHGIPIQRPTSEPNPKSTSHQNSKNISKSRTDSISEIFDQESFSKPKKHRVSTQLELLNKGPHSEEDPFVVGAQIGERRRPRYPGIVSAIRPGATKTFTEPSNGVKKRRELMR
jgi:hypothetical protein